MYSLNFNDIINKLTPTVFRFSVFLEYLYSSAAAIVGVHTSFRSLITITNNKLQFTGQTIYLEHYLNDEYDHINRDIYIEDLTGYVDFNYLFNSNEQLQDIYVYNAAETNLNQVYLFNESEYATDFQFIVWIPSIVTYNEERLRAQIDYYKIAGKNYLIQTY